MVENVYLCHTNKQTKSRYEKDSIPYVIINPLRRWIIHHIVWFKKYVGHHITDVPSWELRCGISIRILGTIILGGGTFIQTTFCWLIVFLFPFVYIIPHHSVVGNFCLTVVWNSVPHCQGYSVAKINKKKLSHFIWGVVYNENCIIFVPTKRINKMNKTNFYLLSFVVSAIGFSFHFIRLMVTLDPIHFLCMSLWGVIVYCLFFIMKVELGIPKKD